MWTDVDRARVARTIADCLPAVAFSEGGRIDDCGLKRTAARRRLQIHRHCQSRSLVAKPTRGRVALPKLSRNNPASRIDFARSAFGVRVRSRTAFGQLVPRRKRTHSLEPLRRFNVLTDHLGLPITAATAEWGAAKPTRNSDPRL